MLQLLAGDAHTIHATYGVSTLLTVPTQMDGASGRLALPAPSIRMLDKVVPLPSAGIPQHGWRSERELNTASSGRCDDLLGVVVEMVVFEAVAEDRSAVKSPCVSGCKSRAQSHAKAQGPRKVQALGRVAGALQRRDLGLVEHGRDHLAALDTNVVASEAAKQQTHR